MKAEIIRFVNKSLFNVKKASPEILVVAGVVGGVVGAVMACKATTKLDSIIDEHKEKVEKIHECKDAGEVKCDDGHTEEYSEKDAQSDLTKTYVKTVAKVVKLYAPAVIVGALSITSIFASHNMMRQRNIALATAFTTVDKAFKEYRGRVIDKYGSDVDKEMRYGLKADRREVTKLNEDGTVETTTEDVFVGDDDFGTRSPYAIVIEEGDSEWIDDMDMMMFKITAKERYANELLQIKGNVVLNDIYEEFGKPRTNIGLVAGWVYDEKNPVGDNFIEFDTIPVDVLQEDGTYHRGIIIDFNVDGSIYNRL